MFAFSCHVQSVMEFSLILGYAAGPVLGGGLQQVSHKMYQALSLLSGESLGMRLTVS